MGNHFQAMTTKGAIQFLQTQLAKRFGRSNGDSGECTISISPERASMTDEGCVIVARGPVRVATILRRVRRKK